MAYFNLEMKIMSDLEEVRCNGDCDACVLSAFGDIEYLLCDPLTEPNMLIWKVKRIEPWHI